MTLLEKLWKHTRIEESTGCRLWIGSRNTQGYGRILIDGKNKYVHRISYNELVKKTDNLILHKDWICPHKNCWNPEHLYEGTYSDNTIDKHKKHGHPMSSRTHCRNGHEYTKENTKIKKNGLRVCLTCYWIRNEKLKVWKITGKRELP